IKQHHAASPWQRLIVKRGDGLSSVFEAAGLAPSAWSKVLSLGKAVTPLRHLHPGDTLLIRQSSQNRLLALAYRPGSSIEVIITRRKNQLQVDVGHAESHTRSRVITGQVNGGLTTSLQHAGLSTVLAHKVTAIFNWRIQLSRVLDDGDSFTVI